MANFQAYINENYGKKKQETAQAASSANTAKTQTAVQTSPKAAAQAATYSVAQARADALAALQKKAAISSVKNSLTSAMQTKASSAAQTVGEGAKRIAEAKSGALDRFMEANPNGLLENPNAEQERAYNEAMDSLKNAGSYPGDEAAMAAMEAAGGSAAQAVRDYRIAQAARDNTKIWQSSPGSVNQMVNGQLMTPEQMQQREFDLDKAADAAYNTLLQEWQNYKSGQQENLVDALESMRGEYEAARDDAKKTAASAQPLMGLYYNTLAGRDDFAEMSAEGPYRRSTEAEKAAFNDMRLESGAGMPIYRQRWDVMTDRELATANYLYNTEGEDAAEEYMRGLETELNARIMQQTAQEALAFGKEHPVWATIEAPFANLANNVLGGAYALGQTGKAILGMGASFDDNNPMLGAGVTRDAMRQGAKQTWFGNGESIGSQIGGFIYDTFNSAALDSVLNMLTFGGAGEVMMGLGAMADTARTTEGTPEQKMAMGIVAGATEVITEHLGYERIRGLFHADKSQILKEILTSMGSEFLEEGTGAVVNTLADLFIMGDESEFAKQERAYEREGMDESTATWRAVWDQAKDIGLEGLGGALGGLMTGGGSAALGQTFNSVADAVAKADINKMSKVYGKAAQAFVNNWDGKTIPGVYKMQFDALYDAGATGLSMDQVKEAAPIVMGEMDEVKAETIYLAGQNAAQAEEQERQEQQQRMDFADRPRAVMGEDVRTASEDEIEDINDVPKQRRDFNDRPQAIMGEDVRTQAAQAEQQPQQQRRDINDRPQAVMGEDVRTQAAQEQQPQQQRRDINDRPQAVMGEDVRTQAAQAEEPSNPSAAEGGSSPFRGASERPRAVKDAGGRVTPGVVRQDSGKKLTSEQRTSLRNLDMFAKRVGMQVNIVDKIKANGVTGGINEIYRDGDRSVTVALDASQQAYAQVAAHGMVHYIKSMSQDAYDVLKMVVSGYIDEIKNYSFSDAVTRMKERYANAGVQLDDDAAAEEVIADATPAMLTNEDYVRQIVEQDRSLGQKILDKVKDAVRALKEIIQKMTGRNYEDALNYAVANDNTELYNLVGETEKLNTIAKTFEAAMEAANEAYDARQATQQAQKRDFADRPRAVMGEDVRTEHAASVTGKASVTAQEKLKASAEEAAKKAIADLKPKTSFSLSEPVERKGELVAVHNLDYDTLKKVLSRNGLIAPSAAIVKSEDGHSDYGDVSAVLYANAVDPTADKANNIYSRDTFTATVPSWADDASTEEILDYMLSQDEIASVAAEPIYELQALTSQSFKNLDEVRERSDLINPEAATESFDSLNQMGKLDAELKSIQHDMLDYEASNIMMQSEAEEFIKDAVQAERNAEAIERLAKSRRIGLPDGMADRMVKLYKALDNMPTAYFEAKMRRIVGMDEIAAFIMPDYVEDEVIDELKAKGIDTLLYTDGDEEDRRDKLNSIKQPGVFFSLSDTSDTPVDTERVLAGIGGRPEIRISALEENEQTAQSKAEEPATDPTTTKEFQQAQKQARNYADSVLKQYKSIYDKKLMRSNVEALLEEIAKNGPSMATLKEASKLGRAVIEKSVYSDTSFRDNYADLRKRLKDSPIKLTDTQKQEAANITGSYDAFRKSIFGSVILSDKANASLNAIWNELSDQYPELFPPDTYEGDMVGVLADVVSRFKPQFENPFGETIEAASTDLGLQLHKEIAKMTGDEKGSLSFQNALYELRAQYKDGLNEELRKIRAEQRQAFDEIASTLKTARATDDKAAAQKAMNRYRLQLRRIGATNAEAMARLTYRQEYESDTARAAALQRIMKTAQGLRRELIKPDKNKHVPAFLQSKILDVLEAIDFSRANGKATEGSIAWKSSMKEIRDFLARQLSFQTNPNGNDEMQGSFMTLSQPQIDKLDELMQVITKAGKSVRGMTLEEINAFSDALSQINHIVNTINTLWTNERHKTMDDLGDETLQDMKAIRTNAAQNSSIAAIQALDTMLNVQNLDAGSMFERLGGTKGAAYSIFEELRKGQSAAYARIREASEAAPQILGFTDENRAQRIKTIRGWAKETHTFDMPTTPDGSKTTKMTMTGTQLMELYALSRRPQARMHILSGGIRVAGTKGRTGDVTTWKISEGQLESMLSELTEDQKETTRRMQDYLSNTVSQWGNEVTERMYLYRMFGEDTYWPIKSEKDYLRTKEQNGTVLFNALTNAGFTKQTQDVVKNPIMIGDALETFSGHVSDMATFSGLAMPVDDFLRWYNYANRDENGFVDYNGSIKKEIRRTTGDGGISFMQNLLNDLNGMGQRAPGSAVADWLMSSYKRAAIAAKLRVVIQQPTAILRASAMINPKYLTGITRGIGKHTVQEMQDHSALAWWKGNGNYEIGTGASMKSIITGMQDSAMDTAMEKLNEPAGWADDKGWATIWQAVKKETAAEHKELTVGSDEYWEHVVNRFEEICMKTQVVDTVLTRSAMMRSKDSLMKMATAFMSEPTKNVNLIRTGLSELYGAVKSGDKEAKRAATVKVIRGAAAITAASALNSLVKAIFDALKYYNPDDEKDEWGNAKSFWDIVRMNWVNNMQEDMNPLTNLPFVKDIWSVAESAIFDGRAESIERMDMSAVAKLANAALRAWKYAAEGNPNNYTAWAALKPLLTSVGDIAGLPVSGLVSDVEFAINGTRNIMGQGAIASKEATATAAGAYDALYKAIEGGDTRKADQLKAELRKKGKSAEDISKGLADTLALEDPRVEQAWRAKTNGKASTTAKLKREIMADGFTDEEVTRAINRYDDVIKSDAKALYINAMEQGKTDKAEQYAEKLRSVGVTDEDMQGWLKDKDLEKQLKGASLYQSADLFEAIRANDTTEADILDIRDEIMKYSEAKDPMTGIRNSLSKEFKQEYIDLVNAGKTKEAEKLKDKLLIAGMKEKTIDNWAPAAAKDELSTALKKAIDNGDEDAAAAEIERMMDEEIMDVSAIVSRLNNYYKPRYIELMNAGKEAEAEALADMLGGLGLRKKSGENYFKGSVFNKWLLDWEKEQEEDD